MKKFFNILSYFILGIIFVFLWWIVSYKEVIPSFMFPSPLSVLNSFIDNFSILIDHTLASLIEAFFGISISILIAFIIATLMDMFKSIYKIFYPILVITQSIPTLAIAPLLVLWFGYDMTPKVVLIVLVCFFPIAISLLGRV